MTRLGPSRFILQQTASVPDGSGGKETGMRIGSLSQVLYPFLSTLLWSSLTTQREQSFQVN